MKRPETAQAVLTNPLENKGKKNKKKGKGKGGADAET